MAETPFVEPVICGKDDEDLLDHCDVHVVDPERVTAVRARLVSPGVAGQMADGVQGPCRPEPLPPDGRDHRGR